MKKILLFVLLSSMGIIAKAQVPSISIDSSYTHCTPSLILNHNISFGNLTDTVNVIYTHSDNSGFIVDTLIHKDFNLNYSIIHHDILNVGSNDIKMVLFNKDFTTAFDSVEATFYFANLNCNTVFIRQYFDLSQDCTYQQGEPFHAPNIAMYKNGTLDRIINNMFIDYNDNIINMYDYSNLDTISFKVENPIYQTCLPGNELSFLVDSINNNINIDFPFNLSDSLNWTIYMHSLLRTVAGKSIIVLNFGNISTDSSDATINFTIPTNFTFDSASNPSYTISGNVVTFDYTNMPGGTINSIILYLMNQDSTMVIGDSVFCNVEILPMTGDIDITNNTHSGYFKVRASYDPNQKTTIPFVLLDNENYAIDYLIEFENLGNDTAFHVKIVDTLSDLLDLKTLKITGNSHEYSFKNVGTNGLNILEFSFPNINLADSSDKVNNKGFIRYEIAPKNTLTHNDTINNTAYIYFDVNEPIVTNTTENYLKPVSTNNIEQNWNVSIYPNPVKDKLVIENPSNADASVTIYNLLGQRLMHENIKRGVNYLDVSSLNHGIYIVECNQEGASKTFKIVKQ